MPGHAHTHTRRNPVVGVGKLTNPKSAHGINLRAPVPPLPFKACPTSRNAARSEHIDYIFYDPRRLVMIPPRLPQLSFV